MLEELLSQARAPGSQVGVGGFGRTHTQLGPGKVLPLPAPNGLGKVPLSGTPLHQATAGKWAKGSGAGPAANGHLRVKAAYRAQDRPSSSTGGIIHLGMQAWNS